MTVIPQQLFLCNKMFLLQVFFRSNAVAASAPIIPPLLLFPPSFVICVQRKGFPPFEEVYESLAERGHALRHGGSEWDASILAQLPGHTVIILPPVVISNLLPCDLHYYVKVWDGSVVCLRYFAAIHSIGPARGCMPGKACGSTQWAHACILVLEASGRLSPVLVLTFSAKYSLAKQNEVLVQSWWIVCNLYNHL